MGNNTDFTESGFLFRVVKSLANEMCGRSFCGESKQVKHERAIVKIGPSVLRSGPPIRSYPVPALSV